jgi:hypothetical protein
MPHATWTTVAALLLAGLSPEQMSRLVDLRGRVRQADYAAPGRAS